MNETQAAAKFLYTVLAAAAGVTALASTRIYDSLAPQGSGFPHVLFSLQGTSDTNGMGQDARIVSRPVMLVKAVSDEENFVDADALFAAVDAVLVTAAEDITVGATTYRVTVLHRISEVRYPEVRDGKHYRHVGGLYRLIVAPA